MLTTTDANVYDIVGPIFPLSTTRTSADVRENGTCDIANLPHLQRWVRNVASFTPEERQRWPPATGEENSLSEKPKKVTAAQQIKAFRYLFFLVYRHKSERLSVTLI